MRDEPYFFWAPANSGWKGFLRLQRRSFESRRAWLCRLPRSVFLWPPKTAGTAVAGWLREHAGMIRLGGSFAEARRFRQFGCVTFGHLHYPSLVACGVVGLEFDREAYKFGVVRNPYTRAVSLWRYLVSIGLHEGDFESFLVSVERKRPPVGVYNAWGISQANPQVDWLMGSDGRLLASELFLFEDLDGLLERLRERLKVSGAGSLAKRRWSGRTEDELRLCLAPKAIRELVERVYFRDFELLGYTREFGSDGLPLPHPRLGEEFVSWSEG